LAAQGLTNSKNAKIRETCEHVTDSKLNIIVNILLIHTFLILE